MFAGFGLALKTGEEIKEMAMDLSKKGKLTEEEGRKFMDEMVEKYEEARSDFEEKVETTVHRVMNKADLARKKDLDELKEEIAELRKKLDERNSDTDQ